MKNLNITRFLLHPRFSRCREKPHAKMQERHSLHPITHDHIGQLMCFLTLVH